MTYFRLAVLVAGLLPVVQAADELVGGPLVVNVGPRSATVTWVVRTSEARLGTEPDQWTDSSPVLRAERVHYTNLKPGTTYYYDVLGQDAGKGSFKTPPAGEAEFRFAVYGDTRTRHEWHQRVADAIAKSEPDFVLHTGDLVADGKNTSQWPIFFSIERELLRRTVFFPSLGNHERNNPQYYEFFDVSTPYYSFDWGAAHFVVLNSDVGNAAASTQARQQYWDEQARWLEEDLRKSQGAALRFAVFHHPPFTAVEKRQNQKHPVQDLVPLLERYGVHAVFNGHDHNYQHHVKNGVRYIVTGGGGAPLYPVNAPIPEVTQKVESVEHFVQVRVRGKQARIEALALDGRVIDSIDIQ
jgi:3',5'-cyclic AMP phosphodiesterase CpdA